MEPWLGGPLLDVAPSQTQALATHSALPQPWVVTVTSAVTQQVLLHQSLTTGLEIIVRSKGVTVTTKT